MTSTVCILPILAALSAANNTVNIKDVNWNTVNNQQKTFVEQYWPNRADLDLLKDGEMKSKASKDVSVVNQFLKDNNFNIQLNDLRDPLAFYVASILKVALEWETEGIKTTLDLPWQNVDGDKVTDSTKQFPAVKFDKEEGHNFNVYKGIYDPRQPHAAINEILEIRAKNGDLIYMMVDNDKYRSAWGMGGYVPFSGIGILYTIPKLWQPIVKAENKVSYDEVIFPMVDIDQEVDIKWLEQIKACDGKKEIYKIMQALQQTKFQMNEKGAKVESAVAISILCTACLPQPKKVFKIEDSFYLWIMRPGMKTPIFAAYIDFDSWKAPK